MTRTAENVSAQYLPSRLTSRETGLSSIFRRGQDAQKTWPSPEKSVGRLLRKVGRNSIWEAHGEAREAFEVLAPEIKDYLDHCAEAISSWVTWSMYMMGSTAKRSSPTIIFCCEDVVHRRQLRDIVKNSGILDKYVGLKTGHMTRAPDFNQLVALADDATLEEVASRVSITVLDSSSAPGTQLVIRGLSRDEDWMTRATVGGVICIGEKFFYTTAAHVFRNDGAQGVGHQAKESDQESDNYDDDAWSFDSDPEDGPDDNGNLATPVNEVGGIDSIWHMTDISTTLVGEKAACGQGIDDKQVPSTAPDEPPAYFESSCHPSFPQAGVDFDWPGEIFLPDFNSGGNDLDYALIEVDKPKHRVGNNINPGWNDQTVLSVKSFAKVVPRTGPIPPVLAITPRGMINGTLASIPSYTRAPGALRFQRMLTARFDGQLETGDSGSWVIDAESGNLYGQIVAGSPSSGAALMTPFADIFTDIEHRAGKAPQFPTDRSSQAERDLKPAGLENIFLGTSVGSSPHSRPVSGDTNVEPHPIEGGITISTKEAANHLPAVGEIHQRLRLEGDAKYSEDMSPDLAQGFNVPRYAIAHDAWVKEQRDRFEQALKKERRDRLNAARSLPRIAPALEGFAVTEAKGISTSSSKTPTAKSLFPDKFHPKLPMLPEPPEDTQSQEFRTLLLELSNTPLRWEAPGLLDESLQKLPLGRICDEAEQELQTYVAKALSLGSQGPEWGYQDCVLQAMMRWFKTSFFTWVNNPPCDHCYHRTRILGMCEPTPEERVWGTRRVELYQCMQHDCSKKIRFLRYSTPWALMETRRGRMDEWANCFGMLCRALGSRVRWVWTAEYYVWVEVYSEHAGRWIHADPWEAAWGNPLLYTSNSKNRMSYCIAFSTEGAVDVTRRYVRGAEHGEPRRKCPESVLLHILEEINQARREKLDKSAQARLKEEDNKEQDELTRYIATSLTSRLLSRVAISATGELTSLPALSTTKANPYTKTPLLQWHPMRSLLDAVEEADWESAHEFNQPLNRLEGEGIFRDSQLGTVSLKEYYGQAAWFKFFSPEKIPFAVDRYVKEAQRVSGVLDNYLAQQEKGSDGPWLVGNKCSYADLSFIMWQRGMGIIFEQHEYDLDSFPHLKEWLEKMMARETVKKVLGAFGRLE